MVRGRDEFSDVNERLRNCVEALQLSVTIDWVGASVTHKDIQAMHSLLEELKDDEGQTHEDVLAISTALSAVVVELENGIVHLEELQRNGHDGIMAELQAMKQLFLATQRRRRVVPITKPRLTTLREIPSSDLIQGEILGTSNF